jgi:hypothetical protein
MRESTVPMYDAITVAPSITTSVKTTAKDI